MGVPVESSHSDTNELRSSSSDGGRKSERLGRTDSEKAKNANAKTNAKIDDVQLRRDHQRDIFRVRPGVIDEEPDSMDSIMSDPSSFPITIVPSPTSPGSGFLIRNSTTQSSLSRLSKFSTTSK